MSVFVSRKRFYTFLVVYCMCLTIKYGYYQYALTKEYLPIIEYSYDQYQAPVRMFKSVHTLPIIDRGGSNRCFHCFWGLGDILGLKAKKTFIVSLGGVPVPNAVFCVFLEMGAILGPKAKMSRM